MRPVTASESAGASSLRRRMSVRLTHLRARLNVCVRSHPLLCVRARNTAGPRLTGSLKVAERRTPANRAFVMITASANSATPQLTLADLLAHQQIVAPGLGGPDAATAPFDPVRAHPPRPAQSGCESNAYTGYPSSSRTVWPRISFRSNTSPLNPPKSIKYRARRYRA